MSSKQASEIKSIITGLLTSNPLKCTVKQLCADFRNTEGYNIPYRNLGFSNVEDYLRSIPDTVYVVGSGPSAEVKGIVKEKSAHINIMVAKQKKDSIPAHKRRNIKSLDEINRQIKVKDSNCSSSGNSLIQISNDIYGPKIPKRIQNNLKKLIMQFPDGIWCRKLPEIYQKMFKENLNYEKFNYRSLIEMCTDLTEIFHYIQPTHDDFMLYDKEKAIPPLNQNELLFDNEANEIDEAVHLDWSLGSALFPPGIVNFLDVIPRYSLHDIKIGDYLDIEVGEILDINNFWIYPKNEALKKLRDEMKSFFLAERNRYVIPKIFFEKGLYCAVQHKNNFYRCVIIDVLPSSPNNVEVLFIDNGSIGKVNVTDTWFLPEQFGTIPCQAIKARLSSIHSILDHTQTVGKFRHLITNAELVAEVMNKDEKDVVLDIYLANVTDENNIFYINDALVEKGYAKYC